MKREAGKPSRERLRDRQGPRHLVVGLGASAGGLEALGRFFSELPPQTGLSFVVVQHLEPRHPSMLVELLARHTAVPVAEAAEGAEPEPDHVYVIAPGTLLRLQDGAFRVTAANEPTLGAPIDVFFRSLAEDRNDGAVGVLFSGAGHDGTAGLRAIKERGGLTLAQAPESAKHDSMPQSAIEAGLVDHVLAPAQMPGKLLEHAGYVASTGRATVLDAELPGSLRAICTIIAQHTGHDFSNYKDGTLLRRIRRRLQVLHVEKVAEYVELLEKDAAESQALVKDLLIGVTQFFRDPDAFHGLAQQVVPRIAQRQPADTPIRIWVPGCASGEESYSIAILVREHLERLRVKRYVQIFATDLDGEMLAEARQGRYPLSIAEQVSPERLARFFVRDGQSYQAGKELREMCLFSQHSLIRDPPFSQLDLISCRNVLIYLSTELQKKLIPLFHYALRPEGFLFLGPSEGASGSPELFELLDKRHRIFRRKETVTRPVVEFPLATRNPPRTPEAPTTSRQSLAAARSPSEKLAAAFERMVLEEYSWPCAVVDEHGHIVLLAGPVAHYLQLPAGAPTTNLLEAVRGGLRIELRAALQAASQTGRRIVRERVSVDIEDVSRQLRLIVRPMPTSEPGANLFAVVLQERPPSAEASQETQGESPQLEASAVLQLESELRATRAELRTTVEELESANEELKSSNEELISTNEELQSANEEMQTSKEELQSLNEELETVNSELQQKVEELGTANSDLSNLFASTAIATIFLDRELRIDKFTPSATKLLHLRDADVGRPLSDLAPRFQGHDLVADAREVLTTLNGIERQVRAAAEETWFFLRVLPYRTLDDVIAGVVVTFVDVSQLKRAEAEQQRLLLDVQAQKDKLAALISSMPDEVWFADTQKHFTLANPAALREFALAGREPVDVERLAANLEVFRPDGTPRPVEEAPPLRALTGEVVVNAEEIIRTPGHGELRYRQVSATPVKDPHGSIIGSVSVVRDITDRKRAEEELRTSAKTFSELVERAPFGIYIVDSRFRIAHMNAGSQSGAFRNVRPVIGRPFSEAMHTLWPDEVAEEIIGHFRRTLDTGEPYFSPRFTNPRADVGVVESYEWELHRIVLPDGQLGVICYYFDSTELRNAEQAVRQSREGLSRLAAASLSVIRESNLEGMLDAVSEAARVLTGARHSVSGHGYVNRQFVIGGSARSPGAPACPPGKTFEMEKGGVYMSLLEGAADSIRLSDAEMRAHPLWWGLPPVHIPMRGLLGARMTLRQGQTNGMILVTDKEQGDFTAEDESLLRQLATVASLALQHVETRISLEEADRNKNQFLAMLSHELRNPLAPISNSLYVLEHAAPGGEQAKRAHAVIDRQVGHLTGLVDDLLDVTRISRGKIQIRREPLELGDLARRVAEDHRPMFLQNGIELDVQVSPEPLWTSADRTRIIQVMGNLLQNAIKFTNRGGQVVLSIEPQPALGQAVMRVRDTGIGIGPEMLPRLFEAFSQADSTLDRAKGGLGLGLALVKGLIEMHGGTVSAASGGLGKGAELTVRLPLEAVRPTNLPASQRPGEGHPRRILVIEDNTDAAESLRAALELNGHTVEVAFSGAEGIEKARAFRPEVVLCDIGLPGINGFEVARALRADPELREATLVALTGYAAPEDVSKSKEAGFDSHLAKPPSIEKIQELLASGSRQ